jgi:hypothetical protein
MQHNLKISFFIIVLIIFIVIFIRFIFNKLQTIDYSNNLWEELNENIINDKNNDIIDSIKLDIGDNIKNLCNINDIFDGTWNYKGEDDHGVNINHYSVLGDTYNNVNISLENYGHCPNVYNYISSHWALNDQIDKYSCHSYSKAIYSPKNKCKILSLNDTSTYFHNIYDSKHIVSVLGDSLSGQYYIALRCSLEALHLNYNIDSYYNVELFYRPDLPCDETCLINKTFRDEEIPKFRNQCLACRDGILHPMSEYSLNSDKIPDTNWLKLIPKNTKILVLGGGAWFNYFHGLINATQTYIEALHYIGPFLKDFKVSYGMDVYWMSLPPVFYNDLINGFTNSTNNRTTPLNYVEKQYEWQLFEEKNILAKQILITYDVTVLDTWKAMLDRKHHDINIAEGVGGRLHWCNPGPYSIPVWLNQLVFHLHIQKQLFNG